MLRALLNWVVVVLFCLLSAAASQATVVTLNISGMGTLDSTDPMNPTFQATGPATTTPFGAATFAAFGRLNPALTGGFTVTGAFSLDFSGGNVLNGTLTLPTPLMFPQAAATGSPTAIGTIIGGTGLFAGATGVFPIGGNASASGMNASTFTLSGSANINVPNFDGASGSGLLFFPVAPCRLADTRNAKGPLGGPFLDAGTTRTFPVSAGACSIPANAAAYSLNVTAAPQGPLSYLTIWPTGQPQPFVSTLNSVDGRVKANAAIVPAGANGSVNVFTTDATDVVLDVNGYFAPAMSSQDGLAFYPVPACRVEDTRSLGNVVPNRPALQAGQIRTIAVTLANCGIPASAKAYSLNFTALPPGPLSYLTVWPAGQPQPGVSTLNAPNGTVVANAAIVPAGAGGAINVFATDAVDLVTDINGYFASPGSAPNPLLFYPSRPCRVLDTRSDPGVFGGPNLFGGQTRSFPMHSSNCGIPVQARAYSLNATVVPQGSLAFLTLWQSGQAQPFVSTLNAFDGTATSNAAIVTAASDGSISAYTPSPTTLVLDINGYFAP